MADDEDADDGGEDSGHGVVPSVGRGDHRGKLCVLCLFVCTLVVSTGSFEKVMRL